MVDVALTLSRQGCHVTAVSRSGLLPRAHSEAPTGGLPAPALPRGPLTLADVRRIVSQHVRSAVVGGADWRAAIDSMRSVTNEIWARLSDDDRSEFLNQDMRSWEVVRHRTAPSVARRLDQLIERQQLRVLADSVVGAEDHGRAVTVALASGKRLTVGAVIDCTGPALMGGETGIGQLLLDTLADEGTVRLHPLRTGLDVDAGGRAIRADGTADPNLFVVGPLRRGALWETTAIPEIRQQAAEVAEAILARRRPRAGSVRDLYGLAITASAGSADLYNEALGRILRVQSGAQPSLEEALDRDPDFALAHAAMAVLGHEFGVDVDVAMHCREADRSAAARGTVRERAFVASVRRRVAGDSSALLQYVSDYPLDVLALSIAIPTIAFSGAYDVPEEAWACLDSVARHYGDDWWFTGLLAFARQDQRRFTEAERLADHSLTLEPRGGTAVHARTHVYYETGEHAAGLRWLDPWIASSGRDATHRAHFSWHAALHELALDDTRGGAQPVPAPARSACGRGHARARGLGVPPLAVPDRGRGTSSMPGVEPVLVAAGAELRSPSTPFAALHAALALAAAGDPTASGTSVGAAWPPRTRRWGRHPPLTTGLVDYLHGDTRRPQTAFWPCSRALRRSVGATSSARSSRTRPSRARARRPVRRGRGPAGPAHGPAGATAGRHPPGPGRRWIGPGPRRPARSYGRGRPAG